MLGAITRTVRDDCRAYTLVGETFERQLRHVAGTENHRAPTTQRAEDLLRQLHRRRAHRCCATSDVRLVTHAAGNEQRCLKEPIQYGAAMLAAVLPRSAHLAVNLRLAENHRVEARGDA